MIDKINRLQKPQATMATIKYGRGLATCETNGEIAALEIDFVGRINAIKKLGEGWSISIGESKMIIYSMAQSELTPELFTYIGTLDIKSCSFATWNQKKYRANIENLDRGGWKINDGNWNSEGRKPEEIKSNKVVKKRVKKSRI